LRRRPNEVSRPDAKLAKPLRGLADKVAKEGKGGNLTLANLQVRDYKVEVIVYLGDLSPQALASLRKAGFEKKEESKAARVLIGTIDVRKLMDLATLGCVVWVAPVSVGSLGSPSVRKPHNSPQRAARLKNRQSQGRLGNCSNCLL